jgi:hypothetical protein
MSKPTYRRVYRKHFNSMADGLLREGARPFTVKAVADALAQGNLNQWFDRDRFVARALGRPYVCRRPSRGESLPYRGGPLGLMFARLRRLRSVTTHRIYWSLPKE